MKSLPATPAIKMKDEGFYDDHSQIQMAIINMTLPVVEKALTTINLIENGKPFVIADYGCSEGKNSVYLVDKIIAAIQLHKKDQLFNVIFNDLPQNNFNKLFENINRWQNTSNVVQKTKNNILTFASGKAFTMQIAPEQSIHFGYSSSAAHWLSELPSKAIESHIYIAGAKKQEKENLSKIAALDWHNFLSARAAEMAPGAKLVVTMAASLSDKSGRDILQMSEADKLLYKKRTAPDEKYTGQIMMDLINNIIQEMKEEKKISSEQAENIWLPIYSRNLEEVLAPIEMDLKDKFIIEQAEIVQIGCPLFQAYLETKDNELFAQLMAQMYQAFMETVFLHQLGLKERRVNERKTTEEQYIVDEIFRRVKEAIQVKPEYYSFFPIHSVLTLTKR